MKTIHLNKNLNCANVHNTTDVVTNLNVDDCTNHDFNSTENKNIDLKLKFNSMEALTDYVKCYSKANGFIVHTYCFKNNNGTYYCGRIECNYKDKNMPTNAK
jgi:hypothetical protein